MSAELRNKVFEVAKKEIGYSESPKNSNKTKFGEWFGLNGVAWCGIFVSWVFDQSKANLGTIDYTKGFAGTVYALNNLKKWGVKIDQKDAQKGDVVFFDWDRNGAPNHVGIFEKDNGDGKSFTAIEGNTAFGNDSNGGSVMQRKDRKYSVATFVRPNVYNKK